jgi:hypothetical protein
VTTAISAIAKRPFAKSSRKINVISSVKDDIFGKRAAYPTIDMGANTNILESESDFEPEWRLKIRAKTSLGFSGAFSGSTKKTHV